MNQTFAVSLQDFRWITQAALQVAAADEHCLAPDRGLMHDLLQRAELSLEEAYLIRGSIGRGDQVPLHFLSSLEARQLCQLVIAAIALSLRELTPAIGELVDEFSALMGLDPLPLDANLAKHYTEAAGKILEGEI